MIVDIDDVVDLGERDSLLKDRREMPAMDGSASQNPAHVDELAAHVVDLLSVHAFHHVLRTGAGFAAGGPQPSAPPAAPRAVDGRATTQSISTLMPSASSAPMVVRAGFGSGMKPA